LLNNNAYTNKFQNFLNLYSKHFVELSLKNQIQLPLLKNVAVNNFLDNETLKTYTPLFFLNPRKFIIDSRERNFLFDLSFNLILKNIIQKKSDFIFNEMNKQNLYNNLYFNSENKL
jgi:hypothetical protein